MFTEAVSSLWRASGPTDDVGAGSVADVTVTGPRVVLPSPFDVTGIAVGAVAAAARAAAELLAARNGGDVPAVGVDSEAAAAAFKSEGLFSPQGWQLPPLWDPIAGNYRTADGWIRLHTNYAAHRAATERVLGASTREAVQAALLSERAEDIESAVVSAGGAAAALRSRSEWLSTEAGSPTADARPIEAASRPIASPALWAATPAALPFSGVRVLDVTRVIAGPVCTKFLAAYGADVLRVDPPGFEEVHSLLPETTLGKRTGALDLKTDAGRTAFEKLVSTADVLVCGLRGDALDRLGYTAERLAALNAGLIVARLDAYGWTGPWQNRRGFDSLVQLSCGIAGTDPGTGADRAEPKALPAQALDHGTGWLLGAAIARALRARLADRCATELRASLIGTANLLYALTDAASSSDLSASGQGSIDNVELEPTNTFWGLARRAPFPARIEGISPAFPVEAGPLGRHAPAWSEANNS